MKRKTILSLVSTLMKNTYTFGHKQIFFGNPSECIPSAVSTKELDSSQSFQSAKYAELKFRCLMFADVRNVFG